LLVKKTPDLVVDGTTGAPEKALLLEDGTLAVPLVPMAAALGWEIEWEDEGNTVRLRKPTKAGGETIPDGLAPVVRAGVEAAAEEIAEIARRIHRHPERGNEEYQACEWLTERLTAAGFRVEKGLTGVRPLNEETVHLATAFKAVYEGKPGGPTIAVMLEYDALPMGHACGHNLIAASGLGAALALAGILPEMSGRLWVIGTPAEEGGPLGGKIPLLKAGHFDGADIVLITHPGDRWDTGAEFLAVTGATIKFAGVPSHAAAAPEKGVSALDAAMITYNAIETVREHIRSDARLHGIISDGGQASNIVPERAELKYGVRALDRAYLEVLKQKVENCAKAGALATGASVNVEWTFGYGSPINVPLLDTLVLDCARFLDAPAIKKWEALGSSDLGDVGYEIPTCNLWFAAAAEGVLPHTHEFMEAAGSPEGIRAALLAAKVIALAAVILFRRPDLVGQIKKDFAIRRMSK
jgi:amidohydrolase